MADLASLSREELIEMIATQQRQIAELREEIEQLRRGGKRQAAPFSKENRVENPRRPGRKPGQGPLPVVRRRRRKRGKPSWYRRWKGVPIVAGTWSRREKK